MKCKVPPTSAEATELHSNSKVKLVLPIKDAQVTWNLPYWNSRTPVHLSIKQETTMVICISLWIVLFIIAQVRSNPNIHWWFSKQNGRPEEGDFHVGYTMMSHGDIKRRKTHLQKYKHQIVPLWWYLQRQLNREFQLVQKELGTGIFIWWRDLVLRREKNGQ